MTDAMFLILLILSENIIQFNFKPFQTDGKVKPQPGYLTQLRLDNRRIKLKDYVGHGTLPGQFTTAEVCC